MNQIWYHKGCQDGYGAAFAHWLLVGRDPITAHNYVYTPVQYGEEPPPVEKGDNVLILDFSFPYKILYNVACSTLGYDEQGNKTGSMLMIDHHETSKDYLEALYELGSEDRMFGDGEPHWNIVHDQERSGAVLTWDTLVKQKRQRGQITNPNFRDEAPKVLQYVQDRDLWLFRLHKTREVSAALSIVPNSFDQWELFDQSLNSIQGLHIILAQGSAIIVRDDKHIKRQCATQRKVKFGTKLAFGEWEPAVICNASVLQSETGHALLQEPWNRGVSFAALYWDDGNVRRWSLRSRPSFNVEEVARLFGGGGHKAAAGFEESPPGSKVKFVD